MSQKLIVLVHGIGDSTPDFYKDWQKVLAKNHDLTNVTVKGLCWEGVLQKVADKYPMASSMFAELVEMCGFQEFKKNVGGSSWKIFQDYVMDLLVYVGLPDMWQMIQNECAEKLNALRMDDQGKELYAEEDTILIGHSLGAAMLPQLVWSEYAFNGTIAYRGMILLASPLGFESPMPGICKDFLQRMGGVFGGSRNVTLKLFARAWTLSGPKRLKFIINENDIVCSDVKYTVPKTGQLVDLIPLRQGFNPAEVFILNSEHAGCVEYITFGTRDPSKITNNHDVMTYLRHESFVKALNNLL